MRFHFNTKKKTILKKLNFKIVCRYPYDRGYRNECEIRLFHLSDLIHGIKLL